MPFFVDDWLSSDTVDGFTLEQQGAYLRLLLRQWKAADGILPSDAELLARWSGLGSRWRKLGQPILDRCFVTYRNGYINRRCRDVWEEARARSVKARESAEERWTRERGKRRKNGED